MTYIIIRNYNIYYYLINLYKKYPQRAPIISNIIYGIISKFVISLLAKYAKAIAGLKAAPEMGAPK